MDQNIVPMWVVTMRAAGYVGTPATRDTLPDPEYVLPARIGYLRHCFRRIGHWLR